MKRKDLNIYIETPKGSYRNWYDPHSGEEGHTEMQYDYGYVKDTLGVDGDEVDVFVGPEKDFENVYIVTQSKKPDFEEIDEQKVFVGFRNKIEAKTAYLQHYDDARFFYAIKEMPLGEFKTKLNTQKGKLIKSNCLVLIDNKDSATLNQFYMSKSIELMTKLKQAVQDEAQGADEYQALAKEAYEKGEFIIAEMALRHAKDELSHQAENAHALMLVSEKSSPVSKSGHYEDQGVNMNKSIDLIKSANASIDEAKMDMKKKFQSQSQRKYMHAAEERGEISEDTVEEFEEKTPKNADLPEKKSTVSKALTSVVVSSLNKRDKLNVAYNIGRAAAAENPASPFEAEVIDIEALGTDRSAPMHEPPVVPVRAVETSQYYINPKPGQKKLVNKSVGYNFDEEAKPIWRR